MRIWIDLGNSPHVPFFTAIAKELEGRGHDILWTARDYAQTVQLAKGAGLEPAVFGTHGGKNIAVKGVKFAARVFDLLRWSHKKAIDLVLSHNSLEPLMVARLAGIRSVNLMDYEHHPNNHVSFRLANRVIVPSSFPAESLKSFGATAKKTRRFTGIKEDVYLADFEPDPAFADQLKHQNVKLDDILIVIRPHAPDALYNRGFENQLLDYALDRFARTDNVRILLLPRKPSQGDELLSRHPHPNITIVKDAVDGANLIAAADLVVSGGGTMNREAAALGVPAATIFTGRPAAIDEYLCKEGRMIKLGSVEDIAALDLKKKRSLDLRRRTSVRKEVVDLILEQ